MGELIDYYIILSIVAYDNDPLKFGRIKCSIPGVIHTDTTQEEAMPWVRPFKMFGYQTFSRPIVGQKVWVLANKNNYNEFWWYPYHETTDLVQNYLNENYDNQPDIFNARETGSAQIMFTYDDQNGYKMSIGDDFINLKPDNSAKIHCDEARVMLEGNRTYCGGGDDTGSYEPCVMGNKCKTMRNKLSTDFAVLSQLADSSPYTKHLKPGIDNLKNHITADILGTYNYLN